jgi:hypothetical protein
VLVRAQKERTWFGKAGENSTIWESASLKFIMGALTSRSMINGSKRKAMSCSAQKITAVVLIIAGAFFTISEAPASQHY